MKQTTVTVLQPSLAAFQLACKILKMSYYQVSPSSATIIDISVKYNDEAELFILGQTFANFKSK